MLEPGDIQSAIEHFEAGLTILKRMAQHDNANKPATDHAGLPVMGAGAWPVAVPGAQIVRTGQKATATRAAQIVEPIAHMLSGARALDYGCGDGSVAQHIAEHADSVVAYDPVVHLNWENIISKRPAGAPFFTNDINNAQLRQPYGVVLCWDVLDHASIPPMAILTSIISMMAPGGVLLLGLHPWTSRHGAHQYEGDDNLAYWHLITPEPELRSKIELPLFRVFRPLATYEPLVKATGLKVLDRKIDIQEPEPYFSGEVLDRIIQNTWQGKIDTEQARKIMAIRYVQYLLQK